MSKRRTLFAIGVVIVCAAAYIVLEIARRASEPSGPSVERAAHTSDAGSSCPEGVEPTGGSEREPGAETARYVPAELDGLAAVAGLVVSPDGKPLGGAKVEFGPCDAFFGDGSFFDPEATLTTNSDGRFAVGGLAPWDYTAHARHPDYLGSSTGRLRMKPDQILTDVLVRLEAGGSISGTVKDETGGPVEGATVCFVAAKDERKVGKAVGTVDHTSPRSPWHPEADAETVTAKDGSYASGCLKPGGYTVFAISSTHVNSEPRAVEVAPNAAVRDVAFVLSPGATVSGRVIDEFGNPVAGAEVLSQYPPHARLARDPASNVTKSALTQQDGHFALSGLQAGAHTLWIYSPDHLARSHQVSAPATGLEIALKRGGTIAGQVVDRLTREPVELFEFEVFRSGTIEMRGKSGPLKHRPGGRFERSGFERGRYNVVVRAPGYVSAPRNVRITKRRRRTEAVFQLVEGTTLEIAVTSAEDGSPVLGARVCLATMGRLAPSPNSDHKTATDRHGVWSIERLPANVYMLMVEHPHFVRHSDVVETREGEPLQRVEIALEKGFEVCGRVVTRKGRLPVAAASVTLEKRMLTSAWTETDRTGSFRLVGVASGAHTLTVSHPEHPRTEKKISVPLASDEELVIELGRGGRLFGTVSGPDGMPLEAAWVNAIIPGGDCDYACTDENGAYEFAHVPCGVCTVTAAPPALSDAPPSRRFGIILDEGEERRLDIVFGGVAVNGVILIGNEPARGAIVMLSPLAASPMLAGGSMGGATADSTGLFNISAVQPGAYRVSVEVTFGPGSKARFVRELTVADQDLEWDAELSAGKVSGTVTGPDGQLLANARLFLVPEIAEEDRISAIMAAHGRAFLSEAWTDGEGRFALHGLDVGSYTILAQKRRYASSLVQLEKPDGADLADIVIRLEREASVTAQLQTPDGTFPAAIRFALCDEQGRVLTEGSLATVNPQTGKCAVTGLGAGTYTVRAQATDSDEAGVAHITVDPGTKNRFLLELGPPRALAVQVEDELGGPVSGAQVVLDPGGDPSLAALVSKRTLPQCYQYNRTRRDGSIPIPDVADGNYTVRVRYEGYEDVALPVRIAGRDEGVTVTLQPSTD